MDDVWVWAILVVAIFTMSGLAGAGLLMLALTKGRSDDPVYRDSARSMAILWFVAFVVAGLVVATSVVNRDSFEHVPSTLVDALPDVIIAVLVVVVGRALALAAGSVVGRALAASSARVREQAALLVRTAVTFAAVVIALAQLGVNTTLLQITGGALLFGLAAAAALLVGLGGRDVASEVAAGRYLARIVQPGDTLEVVVAGESVAGTVVAMHPATIEVESGPDGSRHLPNTQVLAAGPRVVPGPG
ncbi:MAG: hypothetical protein ACXIVQ_13805 [Acidimicrobiales bacterium]